MSGQLTKLVRMATVWKQLKTSTHTLFSPKYLLSTNISLTLALSAVGDCLQQRYEIASGHQVVWDKQRSRNILLSALAVAPACHYWYLLLDGVMPGKSIRTIGKKVFLDQLIMSPICVMYFLCVTSCFEGKIPSEIKQEVKEKGPALMKAEWIVWPPAQAFQFYCLPTRFRILYDNAVALVLDIYYYYVKYSRDNYLLGAYRSNSQEDGEEDSLFDEDFASRDHYIFTCHACLS